jgi:hypothetical protein
MAKNRRKSKVKRKPQPNQRSTPSEQATVIFQQKLRQSPLWVKMVAEFGEDEAAKLLEQFRLDID